MTPCITLIHGWGMHPAIWDTLCTALAPTHTVLTPALPGHDGTVAPTDPSDWVAHLADHLPDDGAVLGWSLGGQVAMQLALAFPHKVARLILVGTTPRFVQAPDWPHALACATVSQFEADFASDPQQTAKRFIALQALGDTHRRRVARALGDALTPMDAETLPALAQGLQCLSTLDLRTEAVRIACPVRLFHGGQDALMPVEAAHWLADHIPGAQMTCFVDAGHAPFLSRPDEFAVLTRRFIDG